MKTGYQESFEVHWSALLGMFRYLLTQMADEFVEIAARVVALAAPVPNAVNMYQVAIGDLGWSTFSAFAFALTLEIVVFLLVEITLRMWDGYLVKPKRFTVPFAVSVLVVAVAVSVVMTIVYRLETHKIMALLPIVSLCSFVGIGLKRWDERGHETTQMAVVPEVQNRNGETITRRKLVATHYLDNPNDSYQAVADALNVPNKSTVYNDVQWLKRQGVVDIERQGKQTTINVNGEYEVFMG